MCELHSCKAALSKAVVLTAEPLLWVQLSFKPGQGPPFSAGKAHSAIGVPRLGVVLWVKF